jgi:hypothetical protein
MDIKIGLYLLLPCPWDKSKRRVGMKSVLTDGIIVSNWYGLWTLQTAKLWLPNPRVQKFALGKWQIFPMRQ